MSRVVAERILKAARAGLLDATRLDIVFQSVAQYGFSIDELAELHALRDSMRDRSIEASRCKVCGAVSIPGEDVCYAHIK